MDVDETVPWWHECAALLAGESFPAGKDDLLAALVRQRAPSRLVRHLDGIEGDPVFADLADLMCACRDSVDTFPAARVAAGAEA